jgi:hypothetical protein
MNDSASPATGHERERAVEFLEQSALKAVQGQSHLILDAAVERSPPTTPTVRFPNITRRLTKSVV